MPRNIVTTTKEVHHEVSPTFSTITAHPLRDLPIHRTPSLPVGICYAMWLMQHVFESEPILDKESFFRGISLGNARKHNKHNTSKKNVYTL